MKLQNYIKLLQDSLSRMPEAEVYTGYKDRSENWDSNRIVVEENLADNEVRVYGIPVGYTTEYENKYPDTENCKHSGKVLVGVVAGIVSLMVALSLISLL